MEIGTLVKFDYGLAVHGPGTEGEMVTAPVAYINQEHRWFGVMYNGLMLTWSFNDLGRVVWLT